MHGSRSRQTLVSILLRAYNIKSNTAQQRLEALLLDLNVNASNGQAELYGIRLGISFLLIQQSELFQPRPRELASTTNETILDECDPRGRIHSTLSNRGRRRRRRAAGRGGGWTSNGRGCFPAPPTSSPISGIPFLRTLAPTLSVQI